MPRLLPVGALLLLLALLSVPIVYAESANDSSPATGHAEVVAQGVEGFAAAKLRWQVRSLKIDPEKEPADLAGPGFVVADKGSVSVVTDTGAESRLAPGEAAFVPAGGATVRALSTSVATIETLELADAAGPKPSGAHFTGEAFAALDGRRDLDLVRDVLKSKEHAQIENGDAPAVVLVIKGAVTVKNANGGTIELTDGKAGTLTGPLTVTATGSASAVFYVGVIGPAVPAAGDVGTGDSSGSDASAAGTINVVTYLCPSGVSVSAAAPETCGGNSGLGSGAFSLSGGTLEAAQSALIDHGIWTWGNLDAGDYTISVDEYPAGYAEYAIDLNDYASHTGPDILVSLPAGGRVTINVYFLASGGNAEAGSAFLGFVFYDCPAGTTVDDLNQPRDPGCTEQETPFVVTLTGDNLPEQLVTINLEPVTPQPSMDGDFKWAGVPQGDYTLTIEPVEEGDTFYVVRPCGDQSCPDVSGVGTSIDFTLDDGGFALLVYRLPAS